MPEPYDLIYKHAFPMGWDMMVISKAWVAQGIREIQIGATSLINVGGEKVLTIEEI
jgi:hypothetical protein